MELVDELFAQYVVSHQAGQSDPRPFLARAEGQDRDDLVLLIDAYLTRVPGRGWDPAAFQGSEAERLVEPLTKVLSGQSGTWPILLPGLRQRAKIKRRELVRRLAEGLEVTESVERVGDYYHGMEQGSVDSAGVSDRVLGVLGAILGTAAGSLRQAGEVLGDARAGGEHTVFARISPEPDPGFVLEDSDRIAGMASPDAPGAERQTSPADDEVDRLFTGGNE